MLCLGSIMLYESQRYIHLCTKSKLLLDHPEQLNFFHKQYHKILGNSSHHHHHSHTKSASNWPEVCLSEKGTGHILDMLPNKQYDEFEYGLSIFRAFAEKIEDYSYSSSKYEPNSIKTFAHHFKKFEHEHKNLPAHQHLSEHHFLNAINHKLNCSNWIFSMSKSSCPSNSTIAKTFPHQNSTEE